MIDRSKIPVGKEKVKQVIEEIGEEIKENAENIANQIKIMPTTLIEVKYTIGIDSVPKVEVRYGGYGNKIHVIWSEDIDITEDKADDNSDNSRSNTDNDKQYNDNVDGSEYNE